MYQVLIKIYESYYKMRQFDYEMRQWLQKQLLLQIATVQMTKNSAVNRNLASAINNWNNCSKCFYELKKSCIFLHDQISY